MTMARLDGTRAWTIAGLLFASQVINYFDKNVMGLAAPSIMRDLGLSSEQYGFVASSFFALYAVSGILVGLFVAHRVRSKPLIAALVVLWSVAQLPIALAPSLGVLVASRVLLGIGEGPGSPTAISAVHEWFSDHNRNMPTALLMLGASLGAVIAGPALSAVMADHGWQAGFLLCGGLGLAWLALWLAFGADGPERPDVPPAAAGGGDAAIWREPTIVACVVTGFCAYWGVGFTVAWLAPLIRLGLGFDARATGWLVAAVSATGSVALVAVSYLSQRLIKRGVRSRLARAGVNAGCMVVGAALVGVAGLVGAPAIKLILLAVGGALPLATFVLGPAIVSEVAPAAQRQRLVITIYSGITIAGFVAPLVAGRLIGDHGIAGYDRALIVNAVVGLIGGFVALRFIDPDRTRARFAAVG